MMMRLTGAPKFFFASVIKLEMPALSPTMSEGNLLTWSKKEGDKVNVGDILCEIQTDKATIGFESQEEGYLAKIIIPQDSKQVEVGKLIGLLVEEKEDVAKVDVSKYVQQAPTPKEEAKATKSQSSTSTPVSTGHHDSGYQAEYEKQAATQHITPSAGYYL